jgi:hypothetical protein
VICRSHRETFSLENRRISEKKDQQGPIRYQPRADSVNRRKIDRSVSLPGSGTFVRKTDFEGCIGPNSIPFVSLCPSFDVTVETFSVDRKVMTESIPYRTQASYADFERLKNKI